MAATDSVTPEPRRFSVRLPRPLWIGLAAVVLILAPVVLRFGGSIYERQCAKKEIGRTGGKIRATPCGSAWLRRLVGYERMEMFENVDTVGLGATRVTDAELRNVAKLTEVEWLWLKDTQITDAGLTHLTGLKRLRVLGLAGTGITDAGLRHLNSLPELRWLDVTETAVSLRGISDLKRRLPELNVEQ